MDPEIQESTHHNEENLARRINAFKEKNPNFIENVKDLFKDEKCLFNLFNVENMEIL